MLLELKGIKKSFGSRLVLDGIGFAAEGSKAFGLLGRNGAGKTTTLRILMDVFGADSGQILLDGRPLDRKKLRFGYLPEERGLYPKKTVVEQLVYFARLCGLDTADAAASVDKWLDRLGMSRFREKKLETLSKGNQQKIQLVTALAHDPDVVILDEPFSGLDPVNAMLLKDVVREELSRGKIVLFSSHQMSYIEEFCDSIAIIRQGRIALTGDLAGIKRAYPRDRLVVRTQDPEPILRAFGSDVTAGDKGALIVRLSSPEDKKSVMTRLSGEFDVDAVEVFEPSLNDIFVEYAGD